MDTNARVVIVVVVVAVDAVGLGQAVSYGVIFVVVVDVVIVGGPVTNKKL